VTVYKSLKLFSWRITIMSYGGLESSKMRPWLLSLEPPLFGCPMMQFLRGICGCASLIFHWHCAWGILELIDTKGWSIDSIGCWNWALRNGWYANIVVNVLLRLLIPSINVQVDQSDVNPLWKVFQESEHVHMFYRHCSQDGHWGKSWASPPLSSAPQAVATLLATLLA